MNQISREFFISKKTMEKQVAYGEAIGNKRKTAAMMRDVGVIAVKRKEVGIAKSGIDVSQAKTIQKEKQREIKTASPRELKPNNL